MKWEEFSRYNPMPSNEDDRSKIKTTIVCPECGKQVYLDNTVVLASNPPSYRYYCECGWVDYCMRRWGIW